MLNHSVLLQVEPVSQVLVRFKCLKSSEINGKLSSISREIRKFPILTVYIKERNVVPRKNPEKSVFLFHGLKILISY